MCNGYPAPRCSRHALNLLNDAKTDLAEASTLAETELAERKLRNAEKVYYMTPAGFKFLEEKLKTETNNLLKDKYYAQLFEGKKARKEAILKARQIARENKTRLEKTKEMRMLSIPRWSIAGQLNIEYLQSRGIELEKTIDAKNKVFTLTYGTEDDHHKVLSIPSKHYMSLGNIILENNKFDNNHVLGTIMNSFSSRGMNTPIDFDELTSNQKRIIWDFITQQLKDEGYDEVIVCNPSVAYSEILEVENLRNVFNLTLYTPQANKTGSDNLPKKEIDDFVNLYKDNIEALPSIVGNKIIVETKEFINNPSDLYVGNKYFLSHLKDNFYSVKKLGKISSYSVRCLLSLQ